MRIRLLDTVVIHPIAYPENEPVVIDMDDHLARALIRDGMAEAAEGCESMPSHPPQENPAQLN